jgi:hypothetical protein
MHVHVFEGRGSLREPGEDIVSVLVLNTMSVHVYISI